MKNISEVFDEVEKAAPSERANVLRRNDSFALRNVLQGTFDPRISFTVKELPPYTPSDSPPGMGYSTIHSELGRIYLFQADNPRVSPDLTEKRKKEILIQILEVLEAREAEIFGNMLLKKQKVKGLTAKVVKEAFPDLLP